MDGSGRLVDAAIAAALGLLVGLEREHREVAAEDRAAHRGETILGVRTFALLALLGWLCGLLGESSPWLPAAGLVVVGALAATAFLASAQRGLTTEVAAVVVFLVGALVHRERSLAVAVALGTTLLLISKPWFV